MKFLNAQKLTLKCMFMSFRQKKPHVHCTGAFDNG